MKKLFLISSSILLVLTLGLFISTTTNRAKQDLRSRASEVVSQVASGAETQLNAYVTAYTYWDNTPPGSSDISHPVLHQKAGGTGTYADPITVAVGHTLSNGNDILDYPEGTKFYIPNVRRYFIVEDTCGDGATPQNGPCHTGYPSGATTWLDIWIDGATGTKAATDACAGDITDVFVAVMNPKANYAVVPGSVFTSGACTEQYGNTLVTTGAPANAQPTTTPTANPTPTTAPSAAPTVTVSLTGVPTGSQGNSALFTLNLYLHGIGNAGDSINPVGASETTPLHSSRPVTILIYNKQNQLLITKQGTVTFDPNTGHFTGTVDMGSLSSLTAGEYTLAIKTSQFLPFKVPSYINVPNGGSFTIPNISLVNGDTNNDDVLNILDYTAILNCFSDFSPPSNCPTAQKSASDLTDDGAVNQIDYNLLIRELTAQEGD